jgi:hypothetical protein
MKADTVTVVLIACVLAGAIMAVIPRDARAETANVTTTWVIAVERLISISYPTGNSMVEFTSQVANFTMQAADAQSDSIPAMRVTNSGSVSSNLYAAFDELFPTGVTEFRMAYSSLNGQPDSYQWWWTNQNATTSVNRISPAPVDPAEFQNIWCWSTAVLAQFASTNITLQIIPYS